jgi:hypothetical protein
MLYGLVIRFFLESYLEIAISSIIQLKEVRWRPLKII